MHDRAADLAAHVVQTSDEIRMRIALMQEQRLAAGDGESELTLEREQLGFARRKIAVIVESRFADGDDFTRGVQFRQQRFGLAVEILGVMRMYAGGRVQRV